MKAKKLVVAVIFALSALLSACGGDDLTTTIHKTIAEPTCAEQYKLDTCKK